MTNVAEKSPVSLIRHRHFLALIRLCLTEFVERIGHSVYNKALMKVYLVRHGETEWNRMGRIQGWEDIPLSREGIMQAHVLREKLKDVPLHAVYSSDLSRAIQTAEIIAEPHGLEVIPLWGLREAKRGLLNGLTYKEIEEQYPDFLRNFIRDPYRTRPPEGESLEDSEQRVRQALELIREENPGKNVLIVSHALINVIIRSILTGTPITPETYRQMFMKNGEVVELDWPDDRPFLTGDSPRGTWML